MPPQAGGGGIGGGLGGIGGGLGSSVASIAVLLGAGGKGGKKWYQKASDVIEKIQDPNFDFSKLTFEELQMVAEMAPQLYDAVVPDEVKVAADSPELRAAQMRGLARMEQIATEGFSTPERLAAQEVGRSVSREGTRLRDAALQRLAQQGRAYGGDVLQAQIGANQQAMELARGFGSDLARYGGERRLQATGGAAALAGQVRGQDVAQRQAAVDAINRFNEYRASAQTQAAQANALARERAQAYNVGTRQNLATQSQLGRFGTQQFNLTYGNELEQARWAARFQRARALAEAYQARGLQADQDKAAREQTIMNLGQGLGQAGGGLGGLLL